MAKYTESDCRLCRREGAKLFLKGERCYSPKCAMMRYPQVPGQHGAARKKVSEYGLQLREKQKAKRTYGLLEKQFKKTYHSATRMKGQAGDNLLSLLERRLDNVVYRMGLGSSRSQARQIVNHAHITVNGKTVNIPSYNIQMNDVIAVKENKKSKPYFKNLAETKKLNLPKWLEFNADKMEGRVIALPEKEDLDVTIAENMIVELYSR